MLSISLTLKFREGIALHNSTSGILQTIACSALYTVVVLTLRHWVKRQK